MEEGDFSIKEMTKLLEACDRDCYCRTCGWHHDTHELFYGITRDDYDNPMKDSHGREYLYFRCRNNYKTDNQRSLDLGVKVYDFKLQQADCN